MIAIRGAIATVPNQAEAICAAGLKLVDQICQKNGLKEKDLIMAQFSATWDLDAAYPAKGVREGGYDSLPMMCYQEMNVQGALKGCIRVMVITKRDALEVHHIYLGEARTLRPDWIGDHFG